MDTSAIDFPALALALTIALAITVVLWWAYRGGNVRRGWIAAATLTALLLAIGLADVLSATPRETHLATVFVGAPLPAFGAMGMIVGTRRVRPGYRWPMVFATAFALLFVGLIIGATVVPKFLPF